MSCKPAYFAGLGTCKKLLQKSTGGVLQVKGKTWTRTTIELAASWQTAIADDSSAVRSALPIGFLNSANTTDEMEILTTGLGHKMKGSDPIPSAKVDMKIGFMDYQWMHGLEGVEFEYFPFFQGGNFWATEKADLNLKGFRCSVATVAGLPPEDKLTSYPMNIFFDDPEEFKKVVVVSPDTWNFSDLLNYVPVGIRFRVSTAYTGGSVIVYAQKTGSGDPMTGLNQTTDWEIMKSNVAVPAVTVVAEGGLGYYTLTLKKATVPVNLAATDYMDIQAHDDDATNLTYLSPVVRIYGGA